MAALAVAGALAVIAGVALFAFAPWNAGPEGLAIDETVFPDETIRLAVTEQLDADGDGVLSDEERDAVTGFAAGGGRVAFALHGEDTSPEALLGTQGAEDAGDGDANAAEDVSDAQPEASLEIGGLEVFPNLKTMVVRDAGLTTLDLSQCPQVEYVDCRQNPLASLDLASNANLTTLFCDEAVELQGLEEAGLYFTDLITGAVQSDLNDEGGMDESWTVEYDTFGRPLKVVSSRGNERVYDYDEQGRLVSAKSSQADWEQYEYGENGLLSRYESYFSLAVGSSEVYKTFYGYDERGRLAQTEFAYGDQGMGGRKSFFYDGDEPSLCFSENFDANDNEKAAFQFDHEGHLLMSHVYEESTGYGSIGQEASYDYNEDGLLDGWYRSVNGGGGAFSQTYEIGYDEQGHLAQTEMASTLGEVGATFVYQCNGDGYLTWVRYQNADYHRDVEISVSYVKMVGSMADRSLRRYVPRFIFGVSDDAWINTGYALTMGQQWWQDTGGTMDATILEVGPAQVAFEAMGLMPRTLSNSNELALAAYDAEHWADGLSLSGSSLLFEEPVVPGGLGDPGMVEDSLPEDPSSLQRGEGEAAASAFPGAVYDIQTDRFAFNLPDSWQDSIEATYETGSLGDGTQVVTITPLGMPNVPLLVATVAPPVNGDAGEYDIYIAKEMLNDGQQVALCTPVWGAMLMDALENGNQVSPDITTAGQWQGILELTLGDGGLYGDIADTPYSPVAIEYLKDMQREYLGREIADTLAIAQGSR